MSTYVYRHYEVRVKDFTGSYGKIEDIPSNEWKEGNYFQLWQNEDRYVHIQNNDIVPCEYEEVPSKWVLARWWKPCRYSYDKENSFKIGDTDAVENYYYEDNGGVIRDVFLSTYFGDDYGLSGRGFPKDMSEDLSNRLNNDVDKQYMHSKTYVTLKEWNDLYDNMIEKFKSKFISIVTEKNVKTMNQRLDYLENVIKFYSNKCNVQDLDMTKKWEENKTDDEEEYYEDTYEGKMAYLFNEEEFHYMMSIKGEMCKAYNIVSEIFGWEDPSNIRIVYYMA